MKRFNLGLNKDGSEIVDKETKVKSLDGERVIGAHERLHQMLEAMLEKERMKDPNYWETNEDDFDFELPDESVQLDPRVLNPLDKRSIREFKKQKPSQKNTSGKDSAGSKSAQSDAAQQLESDNKSSASESSRQTAADDKKDSK